MRSLILVRHAKSSWDDPALSDFARPLNERGRRDAPLMAARLARAVEQPPHLVSSPAVRALSTARVFAEAFGQADSAIEQQPAIYEAGSEQLLAVVRALDDRNGQVALFGHNPGISDFAHRLARCSFDEMPTCAVARIDLDVEHWREVSGGCGRLMAYNFPKERQ